MKNKGNEQHKGGKNEGKETQWNGKAKLWKFNGNEM